MAYTYDDFMKAATAAGMQDKFSQEDLQIAQRTPEYGLSMLKLMQDSAGAATPEAKLLADEAVKQLRTSYGNYSPQISQTLGKMENFGEFTYKDSDRYKQLLDNVTDPNGVSYDPTTDPVWSAYKKNYLREGERASKNAITQASVATGGIPSSYAVTAATQAGNYYADQLSKIIPTLAENDYARRLQALSVMQGERAFDYQKYLDKYNMLGTNLNAFQSQAATEYQKNLDAFEKALAQYQLLGYATPEISAILGIPVSGSGGASGAVSGSGTGSGYTGSVTWDNGSLDDSQVELLQKYLGITKDGKWGGQSQAAAMNRLGVSSADEAWAKLYELANQENINDTSKVGSVIQVKPDEATGFGANATPSPGFYSAGATTNNNTTSSKPLSDAVGKAAAAVGAYVANNSAGSSGGMQWLESYMMSPQLFSSGGNKAYLGGKTYTFGSYEDYTLALVDYALSNKKITQEEAKQLIARYGLG